MTQSTEQERTEFHEWKLRDNPKYKQTDDSMQDRRDWLVWQAARRAQVVHVNLSQADSEKMIELVQSGNYQIVQDDVEIQPPEATVKQSLTVEAECMTCSGHGAVGNILNAEPCPDCTQRGQLAEAAPVQLPEPEFYADDRGYEVSAEWLASDGVTSDYRAVYIDPRYTEQQVRQLLSAHGIK
jgi:hypothetical protein